MRLGPRARASDIAMMDQVCVVRQVVEHVLKTIELKKPMGICESACLMNAVLGIPHLVLLCDGD